MATPTKTQTAIDLVHRLDELKEHRAKMIAELDAEIAGTMKALAALTGEAPSRPTANGSESKPTPSASPRAMPLELVLGQPKKASFADLAVSMLRANPKASTSELAKTLYGEDNAKVREKARAVIYFLAMKAKRIRKLPNDAGWEVIAQGN